MLATKFLRTSSLLLFAFLLGAAVASGAPQKKHIRVAAASDLQTVMPQIAKAFEQQTQIAVDLSFGSSGNFFAQIQNGAPFDLFFSADSEFPARLIRANLTEPRSTAVYAVGSLVLWMPPTGCNPESAKWNCLLQPSVAKIAIANPAHAPYGRAAIAALQSAHIYDQVRGKLVFGENISQAAQFAQSGNAQAGILAHSQLLSPGLRGGKSWEIPRDSYALIEQTVVVLKASTEKSAAQLFIKFVIEGPGRALLEQSGFQPPRPSNLPAESHK